MVITIFDPSIKTRFFFCQNFTWGKQRSIRHIQVLLPGCVVCGCFQNMVCASQMDQIKSTELDIVKGYFVICVHWLLGWCYVSSLHSAKSSNKDKTAVCWCNPALLVLVMFGALKCLSCSIILAIYCLDIFVFLAD